MGQVEIAMAKKLPNIPDSELEVLQALWQISKATVREVFAQLHRSGRAWSYATVSTLLHRLAAKKLVVCDKTDFAHVFHATASQPTVVDRRLRTLIDKVYRGQPGLLVIHLLKSHPLSPEHRQEIRQILDSLTADKSAEG